MISTLIYKDTKTQVVIKDEAEHIQKHWIGGRFYETQRNGLLNHIYQTELKGGKYIDIGASVGNHSLFFANVMKGEVISFEPQADSFYHLQENMELNSFLNPLYRVALGLREGFVNMTKHSDTNVGMYQVNENDNGDTILCPLDNFADIVKGYDVIKIDVEHYNKELLTGAKNVLTRGSGLVYIEAETPDVLKVTDRIMAEYDYERMANLVLNHTPTYLYTKKRKKHYV